MPDREILFETTVDEWALHLAAEGRDKRPPNSLYPFVWSKRYPNCLCLVKVPLSFLFFISWGFCGCVCFEGFFLLLTKVKFSSWIPTWWCEIPAELPQMWGLYRGHSDFCPAAEMRLGECTSTSMSYAAGTLKLQVQVWADSYVCQMLQEMYRLPVGITPPVPQGFSWPSPFLNFILKLLHNCFYRLENFYGMKKTVQFVFRKNISVKLSVDWHCLSNAT